ncbi:uncharacterized protein LOC108021890 [Drosophila biarmipes]|uniref:uncharacterized protein LOC108021890 n=1 Tax=Drosophila biarmipes TaxID=125945 RepID=UPI0007E6E0D1|nr:uncharacterized protein LOC108021890 [Drosophila biarmipes]
MSAQKLLFIALLLVVMMAVAWSLPSQAQNATNTSSERRRLIKDFVAKVHELISILMKQLQQLAAIK